MKETVIGCFFSKHSVVEYHTEVVNWLEQKPMQCVCCVE